MEAACNAARAAHGAPSLLVSNAGVPWPFGPVWDTDIEKWWKAEAIHIRAPYLLMRNLMPDMIAARRGRVICISAIATKMTIPYLSAYSVGKAALNKLVEMAAEEARPHNVQVFAVEPGFVITQLAEDTYNDPDARKWMPHMLGYLDEGRGPRGWRGGSASHCRALCGSGGRRLRHSLRPLHGTARPDRRVEARGRLCRRDGAELMSDPRVDMLESRLVALQDEVTLLRDIQDIRTLHFTYGYCMDSGFSRRSSISLRKIANCTSSTASGAARKAQAALQLDEGVYGPRDGMLAEHVIAQDIVHVAPRPQPGWGRFRALLQIGAHAILRSISRRASRRPSGKRACTRMNMCWRTACGRSRSSTTG